jgi:hypothetical protein
MEWIGASLQPDRPQIGLLAHREQQRTQGLPPGRGQSTLDPADRGLRSPRAAREGALAQAEALAMPTYQATRGIDLEKYMRTTNLDCTAPFTARCQLADGAW